MTLPLMHETIWFDKHRYEEAETLFEEQAAKERQGTSTPVIQGDNIADSEHVPITKESEALNDSVQRLIENNKNMWKCMTLPLMHETIWFDKHRYEEAETLFEEQAAKERQGTSTPVIQEKPKSNTSLVEQIANARQRIIKTLQAGDNIADSEHVLISKESEALNDSVQRLIENNNNMWKYIDNIGAEMKMLSKKLESLEKKFADKDEIVSRPVTDEKTVLNTSVNNHTEDDDDDDVDLFGSDEEDEAANKLREERLKAYETKKSKKTAVIAKSSVVFDIKPWDDETDLKEMEIRVRGINSDGLKWGASKLVPLAYSIRKLQIVCIVEDDKISIDWLQETIQENIEDLVQSVDIVAFNKL